MNWQALLKKLKAHGYTGADNDLSAVEAYVSEHFAEVKDSKGAKLDVKELHKSAFPPKPSLDIDEKEAEFDGMKDRLAAAEQALELTGKNKAAKNGTSGGKANGVTVKIGKDRLSDDPMYGFRTVGEYLMEVKEIGGSATGPNVNAIKTGSKMDLACKAWISAGIVEKATLSTYANEGAGADGGFLVLPPLLKAIDERVTGEQSLLSLCTVDSVGGNSATTPLDDTTPWQTSGAITAEWDGEAGATAQSKPAFKQKSLKLRKVQALVPVTEEAMQDAPLLEGYIMRRTPEIMSFKIDEAIIRGSGVGMPLGILNAGSLVSVAAETNQPATTLKASNVQKMVMRMYAGYLQNSVFLINQDCQYELQRMVVVGKTDAGTSVAVGGLVYIPPGTGLSTSPYGTLMGRPIIFTQHCSTLGTVGDILLADLSRYWAIRKSTGIQSQSSPHFWFDQGVTAFRFVDRVDGAPLYNSTISPRSGSNTMGAFIAVATR